ncbi:MAG: hypothetical protein H0T20_01805 [Actinobacteria bacterium]|nr:hypothetical protein [Actinomycetota bacterium]
MEPELEELPDNRVRLTVDVPRAQLEHAVEHAASDLAESVKIPGFRQGKVPMPVLLARVGRERLHSEAVESHIGGWFMNAAARSRIRPVEQPQYDYELPETPAEDWRFTATVSVQPKPEPADWTQLEVPAPAPEVPEELVEHELNVLRSSVAELTPWSSTSSSRARSRSATTSSSSAGDGSSPSSSARSSGCLPARARRCASNAPTTSPGRSRSPSRRSRRRCCRRSTTTWRALRASSTRSTSSAWTSSPTSASSSRRRSRAQCAPLPSTSSSRRPACRRAARSSRPELARC